MLTNKLKMPEIKRYNRYVFLGEEYLDGSQVLDKLCPMFWQALQIISSLRLLKVFLQTDKKNHLEGVKISRKVLDYK